MYQDQGGHKKVISCASKGLNKAERNYPAHKMEFLALKLVITEKKRTEKFKDYLYGYNFIVLTDNNQLTTAQLNATGDGRVAALAAFDSDIQYRPGKRIGNGDALSRHPTVTDYMYEVLQESVQTVCNILTSSLFH